MNGLVNTLKYKNSFIHSFIHGGVNDLFDGKNLF